MVPVRLLFGRACGALHQGLANYGPVGQSDLLPVFVDKILLEHVAMPTHLYVVCGYVHIKMRELNCCDRESIAHKD